MDRHQNSARNFEHLNWNGRQPALSFNDAFFDMLSGKARTG